jgi:hypothetical protein
MYIEYVLVEVDPKKLTNTCKMTPKLVFYYEKSVQWGVQLKVMNC